MSGIDSRRPAGLGLQPQGRGDLCRISPAADDRRPKAVIISMVPDRSCRYRLGVRTRGSQPRDRGSNPRTGTNLRSP